jgi:hypothetical protein
LTPRSALSPTEPAAISDNNMAMARIRRFDADDRNAEDEHADGERNRQALVLHDDVEDEERAGAYDHEARERGASSQLSAISPQPMPCSPSKPRHVRGCFYVGKTTRSRRFGYSAVIFIVGNYSSNCDAVPNCSERRRNVGLFRIEISVRMMVSRRALMTDITSITVFMRRKQNWDR